MRRRIDRLCEQAAAAQTLAAQTLPQSTSAPGRACGYGARTGQRRRRAFAAACTPGAAPAGGGPVPPLGSMGRPSPKCRSTSSGASPGRRGMPRRAGSPLSSSAMPLTWPAAGAHTTRRRRRCSGVPAVARRVLARAARARGLSELPGERKAGRGVTKSRNFHLWALHPPASAPKTTGNASRCTRCAQRRGDSPPQVLWKATRC